MRIVSRRRGVASGTKCFEAFKAAVQSPHPAECIIKRGFSFSLNNAVGKLFLHYFKEVI